MSWSVRNVQLLVFAATLLAFAPAASADWQVEWDDGANFLTNPAWRGLGPEQLAWMWTHTWMGHDQPLSWMTLGFDHLPRGLDPRPWHVENVLLHGTAAALLVVLLARLRKGAFAAAVLLHFRSLMAKAHALTLHPSDDDAWRHALALSRDGQRDAAFAILAQVPAVRAGHCPEAARAVLDASRAALAAGSADAP
jgi:hypothetical protein